MYYANKYRNGADPKPKKVVKPKKGLKSKTKPLTLVEKLDRVFSQYVRKSSADDLGFANCYTCFTRSNWKKMQCGHFISRKHKSTRWDLMNCKIQCVDCNERKGGNLFVYRIHLENEYGKKEVLKLVAQSLTEKKFSKTELQQMIDEYTELNKQFKN